MHFTSRSILTFWHFLHLFFHNKINFIGKYCKKVSGKNFLHLLSHYATELTLILWSERDWDSTWPYIGQLNTFKKVFCKNTFYIKCHITYYATIRRPFIEEPDWFSTCLDKKKNCLGISQQRNIALQINYKLKTLFTN